jgi:hypothetical protein
MPSMRIDMGGKEIFYALSPYGNMENLEELTLIGTGKNNAAGALLTEGFFSSSKYPALKKLYI